MISLGLFANVDSGKTTLSEAILYNTGMTRKLGRVDHKTAFLDSDAMEKDRGITIFTKLAHFLNAGKEFILIDTPGHRDFGPEMEKAMSVIDYAVLIVSAPDLVKNRTKEIFSTLRKYNLPIFIFVNKMDRVTIKQDEIVKKLRENLASEILDPECTSDEDIATHDETLMNEFLTEGKIKLSSVQDAIKKCNIIPVAFGSALKNEGINGFIDLIVKYTKETDRTESTALVSFKTEKDNRGKTVNYVLVKGGKISVKDFVNTNLGREQIQEIRLYQGENFTNLKKAKAGDIVAITGIEGEIEGANRHEIRPNNRLRIILPEKVDPILGFRKLGELNTVIPSLDMELDELRNEIHISSMGTLELEVLKQIVNKRYGMEIDFGPVSELIEYEEEELPDEDNRNLVLEEFKMTGNDEEDLKRIFNKTYGVSKRDEELLKNKQAMLSRKKSGDIDNFPKPNWKKGRGMLSGYFVIDGYNAMYAWEELKDIIKENLDGARDIFIETLMNYQGYKKVGISVVFDGYLVKGGIGSRESHGNVNVIYTKEAETADKYIQKMIYEEGNVYDYTVVTSDLPVQMAAFGDGARRMSSKEFYLEVMNTNAEIRNKLRAQVKSANKPFREIFK